MRRWLVSRFQKKLLLSYLGIVGVGMTAICFMLVVLIVQNNMSQAEKTQFSMSIKLVQQVDNFFFEMRNTGQQVMSDSRLIRDFSGFSESGKLGNYYDDHIIDYINATSVLASINGSHRTVTRISVYDQYGNFVSTGARVDKKQLKKAMKAQISVRERMEQLSVTEEHILVEAPHEDYWDKALGYQMVSMYCPLGNRYTSGMYGVIEVQQDFHKLLTLINGGLNSTMDVLVFDGQGNCVLATENGICSVEEAGNYYKEFEKNKEEYSFTKIPGPKKGQWQYMTAGQSEIAGWTVILVQNASGIYSVVTQLIAVMLAGAILILILLCFAVYRLSYNMTKPMAKMRQTISNISWENFDMEPIGDTDVNEITALNEALIKTLERLACSRDLELRSRLMALQSQMNPHFLYNALSVISASSACPEKVEDMCVKLSNLLRYITVYEDENTATLWDELNHAKTYLELMKDRYEENLAYEIAKQGDLRSVVVPRVVLQPIVENCFKHGFGQEKLPWCVRVEIEVAGGCWSICVSNNGKRFEEQEIEELNCRVEAFLEGDSKESKGIGLTNTIIRLKLLHNRGTEYEIKTLENGYTAVILRGCTDDTRDGGRR